MMRELEYSVLDVFAEHPLEGNPLAVFHDGRGLSEQEMQAIAREMNLSETTFVLPSDDPEHDRTESVRVRIFTTQEELPFAGHPTLGAASWLYLNHPPVRGLARLSLRLNVGLIPVELRGGDAAGGVYATMHQNDAVFGDAYGRAEVARVLGLDEGDLLEGVEPQTVSTGNPFCIVAMKPAALKNLAIPQREACAWLAERKTRWFYCIAPERAEASGQETWRARMQFYSGEDPATGSAAGCAVAWMVKYGMAASGKEVVLRQGIEIGRPSRLIVSAVLQGERVSSIMVSGRTIPVARGSLFLPV
jgi:trans-2,3-dihydro-3-hydroxyanthranilate isomerase